MCTDIGSYKSEIQSVENDPRVRAIYYVEKTECITKQALENCYKVVHSPMLKKLQRTYDSSVYLKAALHIAERLRGTYQLVRF